MGDKLVTPDMFFEMGDFNPRPTDLSGRHKILSDRKSSDLRNPQILADVLNMAKQKHDVNKKSIDYLINYNKGQQTILTKKKLP